jgi:hypothetical protein
MTSIILSGEIVYEHTKQEYWGRRLPEFVKQWGGKTIPPRLVNLFVVEIFIETEKGIGIISMLADDKAQAFFLKILEENFGVPSSVNLSDAIRQRKISIAIERKSAIDL